MRLVGKWPQMTRRLELPLANRGEAPTGKRSEEAPTARHENARSGARISTSWGPPGWARNLNFSNRPVRTRMPRLFKRSSPTPALLGCWQLIQPADKPGEPAARR
jgi:hypothetical protein